VSDFVSVAGIRLEYAWHGPQPQAAPTLVFLHEGLGSIGQWRDFPAALTSRTGFGALVYSRRGHGFSEPLDAPLPIRFMHDEALTVLPALLAHFQINRPILIGHSTGASIGLIYAGSGAGQPLGVVVEAPHVFVEDTTVRRIAELKTIYPESDLRRKLARHHGNVDAVFGSWTDIWLHRGFSTWNIAEYLPRVACPVLVIQGLQDEYGTTKQVDAIVSGLNSRCESLVLDHCGHAPHFDQREIVETAVVEFVRRLGARE